MATYGDCTTTEDAAISADTETLLADLQIPSDRAGRIKKVFVSYGGAVDAKGATGFVELKLGNHSGPFRFPVGFGVGGATNSSPQGNGFELEIDIPVNALETVKVYVTLAEAAVSGFAGILWEAPDPK